MKTILIGLQPELLPQEQYERIQSQVPGSRIIVTDRREEMEPHLAEIEIAAAHFQILEESLRGYGHGRNFGLLSLRLCLFWAQSDDVRIRLPVWS